MFDGRSIRAGLTSPAAACSAGLRYRPRHRQPGDAHLQTVPGLVRAGRAVVARHGTDVRRVDRILVAKPSATDRPYPSLGPGRALRRRIPSVRLRWLDRTVSSVSSGVVIGRRPPDSKEGQGIVLAIDCRASVNGSRAQRSPRDPRPALAPRSTPARSAPPDASRSNPFDVGRPVARGECHRTTRRPGGVVADVARGCAGTPAPGSGSPIRAVKAAIRLTAPVQAASVGLAGGGESGRSPGWAR